MRKKMFSILYRSCFALPPVMGPVQNFSLSIIESSRPRSMIAFLQTSLVTSMTIIFCRMLVGPLPMPFEVAPQPAKVAGPLGWVSGGGIRIARMRALKTNGDDKRAWKNFHQIEQKTLTKHTKATSFGPMFWPAVQPGCTSQRFRSISLRSSPSSTRFRLCLPATASSVPRVELSVKQCAVYNHKRSLNQVKRLSLTRMLRKGFAAWYLEDF